MRLPEFIYNAVLSRNTSLGNNAAFPDREDVPFEYLVLKERYKEVIYDLKEYLGYIPTVEEAETMLNKTVNKAMELERPLRPQLEKLCEATVSSFLGVPQETIILDCSLTDRIDPDRNLRIMPESEISSPEYQFDDVDEISMANREILKRRMIDSLTQGASYLLMMSSFDNDEIHKWCKELVPLYLRIIRLNDFLLFSKKEVISDENPMLGAYVETDLGQPDDKCVVCSQGLVYPLLLQETYRGFFEIFGSHGLPDDAKKAMYIIRHSDFTMAEAWDLRLGVVLWQLVKQCAGDDVESDMYPYIFSSLAQLDTDEFNNILKNIFSDTRKAHEWISSIIDELKHDKEYNAFKGDIERFNLEKCMITDVEDEDDNDIIES